MLIYLAFLCAYGHCEPYGQPVTSLAQCRAYVYSASSWKQPDANGRTVVDKDVWWECRSRPVQTWELAR